jgi:hypothetical protein
MFKFRGKEFNSLRELREHLERQPLTFSNNEIRIGGKSRSYVNSYLEDAKKDMIDEIIKSYNLFFDGQRFENIGHLKEYLKQATMFYKDYTFSMFNEYLIVEGKVYAEKARVTLIERILNRYV